ncbi:MAG: hypothetical protein LUE86_13750 [Clostridiales bacterium]|nr:hypothetical protein [Clostridiales bacterium]
MKKKKQSEESIRIEEFENLYILTYQTLYRHAELIFDNQEDRMKELLILTYMEAFQRTDQLRKEKNPVDWLLKRADFLAETKLEASREMLDNSYAEEKMQSKEAKKENRSRFDEASMLLEIEDRLEISEEREQTEPKGLLHAVAQILVSLVFIAIAAVVIGFGVWKIRSRVSQIRSPLDINTLEMAKEEAEETQTQETSTERKDLTEASEESEEETEEEIWIPVGGRAVYLTEEGDILYSLSAEEAGLEQEPGFNLEVQSAGAWTYYLPCPERTDSQLTRVSSSLSHTLYRLQDNDGEAQIIAGDVDDYYILDDQAFVYQYGSVKKIQLDQDFETLTCSTRAVVENGEIYLYDTVGRMVTAGSSGTIHYEDRIFRMNSNQIRNVDIDSRTKGQTTFVLDACESGNGIYKKSGGSTELFESQGRTIDCFCFVGDWVYYSSYVRRDENNVYYSEIYKKPIVSYGETELVHGEFQGRLAQMSYSDVSGQIYATYLPESWKSNYGRIAVIEPDGQMSYLEDTELRSSVATTGNDVVQYVLTQDGNAYCYWMDCDWEPGQQARALWRRVLVIPEQNRVYME